MSPVAPEEVLIHRDATIYHGAKDPALELLSFKAAKLREIVNKDRVLFDSESNIHQNRLLEMEQKLEAFDLLSSNYLDERPRPDMSTEYLLVLAEYSNALTDWYKHAQRYTTGWSAKLEYIILADKHRLRAILCLLEIERRGVTAHKAVKSVSRSGYVEVTNDAIERALSTQMRSMNIASEFARIDREAESDGQYSGKPDSGLLGTNIKFPFLKRVVDTARRGLRPDILSPGPDATAAETWDIDPYSFDTHIGTDVDDVAHTSDISPEQCAVNDNDPQTCTYSSEIDTIGDETNPSGKAVADGPGQKCPAPYGINYLHLEGPRKLGRFSVTRYDTCLGFQGDRSALPSAGGATHTLPGHSANAPSCRIMK
ncbi:hypothetical protein SeLEV6574_g01691 [Synchytrium endobioticum]|uniref:Uncharacterized protein n=1 Tax=Synchytrium endobioticum TaxID=286115 RepID=A0A507DBW6_9FUNG|nr:hypothetical protein SeLEV6574_g01691 [Synchytrium endobioticum]